MTNELTVWTNTARTHRFTFIDNTTGTALNINGYTHYFTVKENDCDSDADAIITKVVTSHVNGTAGITDVSMGTSDLDITAKTYIYGSTLKDSSGNPLHILKDRYNVKKSVRDTF